MDMLRDHVAAAGIETEGLVIAGVVGLTFAETKTHYDGSQVDEYKRVVLSLGLEREGEIVFPLEQGSAIFKETARILDSVVRLPLYTRLVEHGGPALVDQRSFKVAYAKVDILARAEKAFYKALITNDRSQLDEIAWIRFQQSDPFERQACSRAFFIDIRNEFIESPYRVGMDLGDYYNWYWRSADHLDADGRLTTTTLERANSMLDAWSNNDADSNRFWLTRNLEVHPRHMAAFHALVDARSGVAADDADDMQEEVAGVEVRGPGRR